MQTITRQQFQEAIEKGIERAAEGGHTLDIAALRVVGQQAKVCAVGRYFTALDPYTTVCCPVALAHADYGPLMGDLSFARGFDNYVERIAPDARVVEVID